MKKPSANKPARSSVAELHRARLNVAAAEGEWRSAREAWRQAKHRRKAARLAARRVRKRFKHSKAELAEARRVLEEIELRAAKVVSVPAKRRRSKAKPRPRRTTRKSPLRRVARRTLRATLAPDVQTPAGQSQPPQETDAPPAIPSSQPPID